jgi:hypothetical protein
MSEKGSSGVIQIVIALITVLGVAYITTGAKFQSELQSAKVDINKFSKDLDEMKKSAQGIDAKLTSQQSAVEKRIAELQTQLLAAEEEQGVSRPISLTSHVHRILKARSEYHGYQCHQGNKYGKNSRDYGTAHAVIVNAALHSRPINEEPCVGNKTSRYPTRGWPDSVWQHPFSHASSF